MVIVSLNPGIISQRVNTNQLINIIARHSSQVNMGYISIVFIGYMWWLFWVAMKWNEKIHSSYPIIMLSW